jgi:saccharopine dehydrogenase (NAD+, L-lysine-forming)
MRMMLVGAGAVGESLLKILERRDPDGGWLTFVLICDYDGARAEEVRENLEAWSRRGTAESKPGRYASAQADARDRKKITELAREYEIDFIMDAAAPFASNPIFDAAFEAGTGYASLGTWSVPKEEPAYGLGLENSYDEPMTKYNFDRHEAWKEKGQMAVICLGIDPGVVNVFAKYAATHLFDVMTEAHVKDGGNLTFPGSDPDQVHFGFNVWTVLDEVMNPNAEYDEARGGIFVEPAFAGRETFRMPAGIGLNTLVKVEHEEVVTFARYLKPYGLKRATFKIALEESLIRSLKVIDQLGLRSLKPVTVNGAEVIPRDVVAACAPQPREIGGEMTGEMCVGVDCFGIKDGKPKEYFLYQRFDNQESIRKWGLQAVVVQTGFGAALALELIGKGIWKDCGVFSPEYFDPEPYLALMDETGFAYQIEER